MAATNRSNGVRSAFALSAWESMSGSYHFMLRGNIKMLQLSCKSGEPPRHPYSSLVRLLNRFG